MKALVGAERKEVRLRWAKRGVGEKRRHKIRTAMVGQIVDDPTECEGKPDAADTCEQEDVIGSKDFFVGDQARDTHDQRRRRRDRGS
jgi:hypothetical protein